MGGKARRILAGWHPILSFVTPVASRAGSPCRGREYSSREIIAHRILSRRPLGGRDGDRQRCDAILASGVDAAGGRLSPLVMRRAEAGTGIAATQLAAGALQDASSVRHNAYLDKRPVCLPPGYCQ